MISRAAIRFRPSLRMLQSVRNGGSSYQIMEHPTHGKIQVAKFRGATLQGPAIDAWPGPDFMWGLMPTRHTNKFIFWMCFWTAVMYGSGYVICDIELRLKSAQ